jgi:FkbM family methyltransferase
MNLFTKVVATLNGVRRHPLSKGRELRSMWEFVVAQIASRRIPGGVCVELANGTQLLVPPAMKGAAHFIYPGMCEFDEMAFVLHYLRPGDLFVDIGANIGAYTVLAAGGVKAEVIAFEPSPSSFAHLGRNIALNGLRTSVQARNVALAGASGFLEFTKGLGTENFIVAANADYAGSTDRIAINTLNAELSGTNPRLIKVDVEGYETEVFAAGEQVLQNKSVTAMIVERNGSGNRYGYDEAPLHARIRKAGFAACRYRASDRSIDRVSDGFEGNIVYLRDPESTQSLVRAAVPFRVKGLAF